MKNWPDKDPDEVLDYAIDWSPRLVQPNGMTDQIDTSMWILPSGITQTSASISGQLAVVWLSGGSLGDTYTITNRIVTVGGRTMDQSVRLRIKAK